MEKTICLGKLIEAVKKRLAWIVDEKIRLDSPVESWHV